MRVIELQKRIGNIKGILDSGLPIILTNEHDHSYCQRKLNIISRSKGITIISYHYNKPVVDNH